jgi:hypothetical protein
MARHVLIWSHSRADLIWPVGPFKHCKEVIGQKHTYKGKKAFLKGRKPGFFY